MWDAGATGSWCWVPITGPDALFSFNREEGDPGRQRKEEAPTASEEEEKIFRFSALSILA